MNAATSSSQQTYRLKVSRYDQVSSMMLSLVILLGLAVLLLFLYWLTVHVFGGQPIVDVQLAELGEGNDLLAGGMEIEGPIEEEIGRESDLDDPAIEHTLAAIADTVGKRATQLDDPALTDQMVSGKGGGSRGDGRGVGSGSGSGSGSKIHRELRFHNVKSLDSYAKQLDFFKIELGVVMPGNRVIYVSGLSTANPRRREQQNASETEKRYYFGRQTSDELEAADRQLLARAGVADTQGRHILKFVTPEVESKLATLERARAGTEVDLIRKTIFYIVPTGSGYKLDVLHQLRRSR